MTNAPPPEVAAAAEIVDRWLKGQPPIANTAAPPPPTLSAAERFKRAREIDQSKMPAWKDPRAT